VTRSGQRGEAAEAVGRTEKALSDIGFVFDDPPPPLCREPIPNLSHVLKLFFISGIFRFSRYLTALSGELLVFQDFLHSGAPNAPQFRQNNHDGGLPPDVAKLKP